MIKLMDLFVVHRCEGNERFIPKAGINNLKVGK
jgi:hypothetical protein